jgi:hypothetical protein
MGALRAILIVISIVLMANQASAKKYYLGAGGVSCGAWLETRKNGDDVETFQLQAWVQGFVSGVNATSQNDFLAAPDAEAIFAWLDNYCRQHPLEKVIEASHLLILELKMRAAGDGTKTK